MSDESLARMVAVGNRLAFSTLYKRYRVPLSRYCRSILHNPEDTADAFQNAMLKALAGLEREAPSGPLRPWLYRIAHNESIDVIRRRQRSAEELVADTPDVTDLGASTEVADQLQALFTDLRELPERQRGALLMRELAGLEYEQIGRVFTTSTVAARKLVYEARVTLNRQREGRSADCDAICRQLSEGDGRTARARTVRSHLTTCEACAAFERSLRTRREQLALIPALPLLGGGAWLATTLGGGAGATKGAIAGGGAVGGAITGGSALSAGVSAGAGSAGVLSGLSGAVAVKCLTVCGALAVAGAGAAIASSSVQHHLTAAHGSAAAGGARVVAAVAHAAQPAGSVAHAASAQADSQLRARGSDAGAAGTAAGATHAGGAPRGGSSETARFSHPTGVTGGASLNGAATRTVTSGTGSKPSAAPSSSAASAASAGSTPASSAGATTTTLATTPTTSSAAPSSGNGAATGSGSTTGTGLPGTGTTAASAGGGSTATASTASSLISSVIASSMNAAAASTSQLASSIESMISTMLGGSATTSGQSTTTPSSDSPTTGAYGGW